MSPTYPPMPAPSPPVSRTSRAALMESLTHAHGNPEDAVRLSAIADAIFTWSRALPQWTLQVRYWNQFVMLHRAPPEEGETDPVQLLEIWDVIPERRMHHPLLSRALRDGVNQGELLLLNADMGPHPTLHNERVLRRVALGRAEGRPRRTYVTLGVSEALPYWIVDTDRPPGHGPITIVYGLPL